MENIMSKWSRKFGKILTAAGISAFIAVSSLAVPMEASAARAVTDDIMIRNDASREAGAIGSLQEGEEVTILDAVQSADGYVWYYIQLENGVGMTRMFLNEISSSVEDYLTRNKKPSEKEIKISTISGTLVYPIFCKSMEIIKRAMPKADIKVYKIINNFFGEKITVTGLLTGQDIIDQLKDKDLGDVLLLPSNTLKADEDIFLDDVTLEELQNALQVPVIIVQSEGMDFFDKILEL